jgi:hypothetical protein
MGYAKHLTRALRSNPFPTPHGLVVTGVSVYLYRDAQPRPPEHFHSDNVVHNPKSPYGYDCISNHGTFLAIHTDHDSLKRDEPLWFHMDALALDVNSCGIISFRKAGGGGWGVLGWVQTGRIPDRMDRAHS